MRARNVSRRTLLTVAAFSALALTAGAGSAQPAAGAVLGRAKAPVTVTEYASPVCSHCADWDKEVWPAFKAKYVDTGLVRWELREMLTAPVGVAAAGWLLAGCAPQGKYLQVIRSIYDSQAEMARTGDARGVLQRIAAEVGLDQGQFERCVTDEKARAALNTRVQAAVDRGVNSTPAFFINGRKHEGAISLEALDAALQPLVAGRKPR